METPYGLLQKRHMRAFPSFVPTEIRKPIEGRCDKQIQNASTRRISGTVKAVHFRTHTRSFAEKRRTLSSITASYTLTGLTLLKIPAVSKITLKGKHFECLQNSWLDKQQT
ncbi:hypothetical protein CEXT_264711 [Caerostris extrusa]|uniref:Uncharacterized protein n=1 Tax=Caerostris extrusa TaxID=172846 RepID=A0AAV4U1W9_CAEEX|nr:hypothetical protein CEXT_264711 [Caerostris extrusa]